MNDFPLVRLFLENPVAQSVGVVALVVSALSYQARTTRAVAARQAAGSVFWIVHLAMLGASAGAALNVIGLARGMVYSRRGVSRWASRPAWPWLFFAVCAAAAAWAVACRGEGPRILLSFTAQSTTCHALWTTNVRRCRTLFFFASVLWLCYDALSGSIPGTACELASEISIIVAALRFRAKPAGNPGP